MSELIDHDVNGLLFERGDVEGLATAIGRFVADPALRERLRQGIRPARTIEGEVSSLIEHYRGAAEPVLA
jgi:glycosyltransferase involved in cell wall biosynthesis